MSNALAVAPAQRLRRVLILADESADWKIAGLRQLDRLALCLQEFVDLHQPEHSIAVCVLADGDAAARLPLLANDSRISDLRFSDSPAEFFADDAKVDLVLSTRVFLSRDALASLLVRLAPSSKLDVSDVNFSESENAKLRRAFASSTNEISRYLNAPSEIADCERRLLRGNGKSQDGLVSRHLNRRISRAVSRWLLKLPISPTLWSTLIFILPIVASFAFLRGNDLAFLVGAAIFQLYSILDGCDGEIARAKFMQTEFGRRFDSFCDLVGNILLALTLGFGLARQANPLTNASWFYAAEGIATAMLIITSEGIVFARRSRAENNPAPTGRWEGVLYQRHHEFLERSGILILGERAAFWIVQLTKRDMAMLAFLLLALFGVVEWSLHLLLTVSALSSALAGKAFLRSPTPALAPEAS